MKVRLVVLLLAAVLLASCQVDAVEPAVAAITPSPRAVDEATREAAAATPVPTWRPTPAPTARLTPSPVPTASPTTTPTPSPQKVAFAFDLYEEGDFVPQHTFEWCVGASIQMAHNLVFADRRSSYEDQQALWELARSHSTNSFNGANPRGWATALTAIGVGDYRLVSIPDYGEALRTAAEAIRDTGRPVGLVMWRGRHAWVMSGFESLGDPALHADFAVTGIRVLDPLYPHGSGIWGPSPEPNRLLTPDELAAQFVIREPRRWSSDLPAGYLLVLPTRGRS
ncbi:MAG TPA: hypothetical protein VHF88_00300 [Thermoleophilaceae bacterium]|nr:hypothetical protein [Thermoleophilaceae bacterium]